MKDTIIIAAAGLGLAVVGYRLWKRFRRPAGAARASGFDPSIARPTGPAPLDNLIEV